MLVHEWVLSFLQYFSALLSVCSSFLLVILRIFCTLCTFFLIKNVEVNIALRGFGINPELT